VRMRVFAGALAALAGTMAGSAAIGAEPEGVVREPEWLRKPSAEDMKAAWPVEAARSGKPGKVVLRCEVDPQGLLQKCAVLSETPPGLGFGGAALMIAPSFKMKPRLENGQPVRGVVTIPIAFGGMRTDGGSGGRTAAILDPVWARAPSFRQMQLAWPQAAGDLDSGGAVLRCKVTETGWLKACTTYNELPGGKGFAAAAKTLVQDFQLVVTPDQAKALKNGWINVTFRFLNPGTAAGQARKISGPRWITTLDASKVLALYPEAAADKGVGSGQGVADCAVASDGRLVDCKVARETPEGLGFGPAAVMIAGVMQMNPWTAEGRPVDGARIRLPINFNLATDAAKKAP
jgi:TonB family protein